MRPISYSESFVELNFFEQIGRLPNNQLINQWIIDEDSNRSSLYDRIFSDFDSWRNKYWNIFSKSLLKKLPCWSHEREFRIILSSLLDNFNTPEKRLFTYEFNDLEAIIFGLKTPKEAKLEIIKIIKEKCKKNNRKNFDFYEITCSHNKENLKMVKLHFLNLFS